ncbi:hypothetical protein VI817_004279 [Penicillium citrinum]|nr:hypothetical protein VI817_004279 [Penicillium citrinum]
MALESDTPPLFTFQTLVLYYSSRNLTHASDAINAIAGTLRFFETRLHSPMLYGLPLFSLDISLLFYGMRLQRRPEFPSYSWAGWTGEIQWSAVPEWSDETESNRRGPAANDWLDTRTWIVWYQRKGDGNIQHLLEDTEASDVPKRHIGYRHRHHTWLTGMNVIPTPDLYSSIHNYTLLQFWTYSAHFKLRSTERPSFKGNMHLVDSEDKICGRAFIHEIETIQTEVPVELLILSECSVPLGDHFDDAQDLNVHIDNWQCYWIMIISWEDGVASRRGIGTLDRHAINQGYPPGLEWKEVLLG